ncbi:MAG: hypothetical protein V1659_04625, partial [Candidatus Woesearchaeota archaeon]
DSLKEKAAVLDGLRENVGEKRAFVAEEKRKKIENTLEQGTKDVEEKLKKRQKLTTEDLLIFQAKDGADFRRKGKEKRRDDAPAKNRSGEDDEE